MKVRLDKTRAAFEHNPDLALPLYRVLMALDALGNEVVTGRDVDGQWSIKRYAVELGLNTNGDWLVSIKDWTRVGPEYATGDELSLGIDRDPLRAITAALAGFGLEPKP